MKAGFGLGLAGAAVMLAALSLAASAQVLPRIKAKVVSFDGTTLVVAPLPAGPEEEPKPDAKPDETMRFTVLPETRYVATEKAALTDIKVGDFAGATVRAGSGSKVKAEEVFLYPEALRGTGEGRFTEKGRLMINGTVSAVAPGQLTVHYRGLAPNGKLCEGRAPPPAVASRLTCTADAVIGAGDGVPVTALTVGDASMVAPGAVVMVSVAKNREGAKVTPGLIVEKPDGSP
jgi:hypothetical protein